MKVLHSTPLLRYASPEDLYDLRGLAYDEGFKKLAKLIETHVERSREKLVWDVHLSPEDRDLLAREIRLFEGILDLPDLVKQKYVNEG